MSRRVRPDLPRYTWDQAEIMHAWPPASYAKVGINPATVRGWASRGLLKPVARGPNGCRLYEFETVTRLAEDKGL